MFLGTFLQTTRKKSDPEPLLKQEHNLLDSGFPHHRKKGFREEFYTLITIQNEGPPFSYEAGKLMARGVGKSLRAVILEARGTHKPEKMGFVEAPFFSRFSESKRGGWVRGSHRGKWPVVP